MTKDMFEELFIDTDQPSPEYCEVPGSKKHCLSILNSDCSFVEKIKAANDFCNICRYKAFKNGGKISESDLAEMIAVIVKLGEDEPEFCNETGISLVLEGTRSEKDRDYRSAFRFYCESLKFEIADPFYKYFQLNNYGFCLNFMQKFGEAEEFLRAAIAIAPNRYNALKNLGVSLEHQGRFVEAAECYYNAVFYGRGEARAVAHYKRLLERQPSLKENYPQYEVSLNK